MHVRHAHIHVMLAAVFNGGNSAFGVSNCLSALQWISGRKHGWQSIEVNTVAGRPLDMQILLVIQRIAKSGEWISSPICPGGLAKVVSFSSR